MYEGIRGELCLHCEDEHPGANCTNSHLQVFDPIVSLPGWWRFNRSLNDPECHPLRTTEVRAVNASRRTGGCPVYKPCEPVEACVGENLCAYGYEGDRCSQCLYGEFHRVNG